MVSIRSQSQSHKLYVLEDAAQAHGAKARGESIGYGGSTAAWSFYPSKNLGCFGDGGAITTDDDEIAERVRTLRNYGSPDRYVNEVIGWNSRLDEIQAAVLRAKLPHLDTWNERRVALAARYLDGLAEVDLGVPSCPTWAEPVWHLFVVRMSDREGLRRHLAEASIATQIHYPISPHLQVAYRTLGFRRGDLPVAERLQDEVLSLPMGPHMTAGAVDEVVRAVQGYCSASSKQ
jgi:dTDP-4-amino-4,6-dideoxygalactose transaminase